MSVEQTELYNYFKSGDLLYGLNAEQREAYIGPLKQKTGAEHVVIDTINGHILPELLDEDGQYLAQNEESIARNPILNSYAVFYKTVSIEKLRITYGQYKTSDHETEVIKRCCKAMLINNKVTKHFILDDLSLRDIFSRQGEHAASFTSSEVRFIFNHWDQVNGSIRFYDDGDEVTDLLTYIFKKGAMPQFQQFLMEKPKQNASLLTQLAAWEPPATNTRSAPQTTPPRRKMRFTAPPKVKKQHQRAVTSVLRRSSQQIKPRPVRELSFNERDILKRHVKKMKIANAGEPSVTFSENENPVADDPRNLFSIKSNG